LSFLEHLASIDAGKLNHIHILECLVNTRDPLRYLLPLAQRT